jgi:hypothetical protein
MTIWGVAATEEADMLSQQMTIVVVPPEPDLTPATAFEELEAILYTVAASPPQHRKFAVRYMQCRDVLMGSELRATLPGFMLQTGTIDKYRDFITLYDRDVPARRAFLDHALGRCRALVGPKRVYDDFADLDF